MMSYKMLVSVALLLVVPHALGLPTPSLGYINYPDPESGAKVAAWTPESGTNPEELGNYFESDIMLTDAQMVNPYNGLNSTSQRWPSATVPYVITSTYSASGLAMLKAAINEINTKTCVKFIARTTQTDYVSFRNNDTGCYSYIGKTGGMQIINLQEACLSTLGTPIHEMLHTLGFFHQQSATERDTYVTINLANVIVGKENNFRKEVDTVNFGVVYDYGSVMHYGKNYFSSNGLDTITPKQAGAAIGQRDGFSAKDIAKVKAMYKCP